MPLDDLLEEELLTKDLISEITERGFEKKYQPNRLIFTNNNTEMRISYDKKNEIFILSFSTDKLIDNIALKSTSASEVRLTYNENNGAGGRYVLSMSSLHSDIKKNALELARQYSKMNYYIRHKFKKSEL